MWLLHNSYSLGSIREKQSSLNGPQMFNGMGILLPPTWLILYVETHCGNEKGAQTKIAFFQNEPCLSLAGTMTWQACVKAVEMSLCWWFTKNASFYSLAGRGAMSAAVCRLLLVEMDSVVQRHTHTHTPSSSDTPSLSLTPNWSLSNSDSSLQLFTLFETRSSSKQCIYMTVIIPTSRGMITSSAASHTYCPSF